MTEAKNQPKFLPLAILKVRDFPEWPATIAVESEGMVFQVGYKPIPREYVGRSKNGDHFATSSLSVIKAEIKSFAAPFAVHTVTVDGVTTGFIMNQDDLFFYRPVLLKGFKASEKFYSKEEALESLKNQSNKPE